MHRYALNMQIVKEKFGFKIALGISGGRIEFKFVKKQLGKGSPHNVETAGYSPSIYMPLLSFISPMQIVKPHSLVPIYLQTVLLLEIQSFLWIPSVYGRNLLRSLL